MRRVDQLAAALGRPTEDLVDAMRKHAAWETGPDAGRIASISVRVNGRRRWNYGHDTAVDRVARALNIEPDEFRDIMRRAAVASGRTEGVWTITTRVW